MSASIRNQSRRLKSQLKKNNRVAHIYKVRPRKDHRGVDLISDVLPFGWLWYPEVDEAIDYAKYRSRAHSAVIRVYDDAGNVTQTHEHNGDFKEW